MFPEQRARVFVTRAYIEGAIYASRFVPFFFRFLKAREQRLSRLLRWYDTCDHAADASALNTEVCREPCSFECVAVTQAARDLKRQ